MRRSLLVSLLVLGALAVVQVGSAQAAPSKGARTLHFDVVCDGVEVAVITASSANSFWTIDESGTSQTPGHVKELAIRGYPGALTVEPSTEPLFSDERSFGKRVGQGETTHCSGHDVDSSDPQGPVTVFFDVEVTGL